MKQDHEKKWTLVKKNKLYSGYFEYLEALVKYKKFDNTWSDEVRREIFERGDAVAVLIYDPKHDTLIMVEQSPENCAVREVKEETGIDLKGELTLISDHLVSPGATTERMWLFYAEADSQNAGGVYGLDSIGENTKVIKISRKRALKLIAKHEIFVASVILAIYWLENKLKNE
jgi:ADP-ribose pyrophosphatase